MIYITLYNYIIYYIIIYSFSLIIVYYELLASNAILGEKSVFRRFRLRNSLRDPN